jgi:hypothetical protein
MATTQAPQAETDYQFAEPADVRKILENYPTSVGPLKALPGASPHPGLNGKRVVLRTDERKTPEDNALYFVWGDGFKCWVPDPPTFDALFANLQEVIVLSRAQLDAIATGPTMSNGAAIVRADKMPDQYLVSNKEKHLITSMKVLQYCHFTEAREVPLSVIEAMPTGFKINYGDNA